MRQLRVWLGKHLAVLGLICLLAFFFQVITQPTTKQLGRESTIVPLSTQIAHDDCILNGLLPWTPPGYSLCDAIGKVFQSYILQPVQDTINNFTKQADSFLWETPAIYDSATNSGLTDIWRSILLLVDSLVALVVAGTGIKLMLQKMTWYNALNYADTLDALPRILFALLAAHFSLHFFQILILGNNALSHAFTDHQLIDSITSNEVPAGIVQFLRLFYAIMALLLIFQAAARIGGLYILMILSPIWFFCWAAEEIQPLARAGTTATIGLVFLQATQLLMIAIGGHLLATITLGNTNYQLLNVIGGIIILYIALKTPGWIGKWVFSTAYSLSAATANAARLALSFL